jgi:hypothetical protein
VLGLLFAKIRRSLIGLRLGGSAKARVKGVRGAAERHGDPQRRTPELACLCLAHRPSRPSELHHPPQGLVEPHGALEPSIGHREPARLYFGFGGLFSHGEACLVEAAITVNTVVTNTPPTRASIAQLDS